MHNARFTKIKRSDQKKNNTMSVTALGTTFKQTGAIPSNY